MKALSFLEDNSGGFSAIRLALLLWVVGVLIVWGYIGFKAGKMDEIPGSVVTIIGILVTGKTVQRFGEKPDSTDGIGDPDEKAKKALSAIPPLQ